MKVVPLSSQEAEKKLIKLAEQFEEQAKYLLGYPLNQNVSTHQFLKHYLKVNLNNAGDPFKHNENSHLALNTHEYEMACIKYINENIFNLPEDYYWGYFSSGSTESNIVGLDVAYEHFNNDAIIYFSDECHYSIEKACALIRAKYVKVASTDSGEMDYADFKSKLNKHKPAIVVATLGSTMKGSIDNPDKIVQILEELKVQYLIHADCALNGLILPFTTGVKFMKKINSLCISAHKFIGSHNPFSVCLVNNKFLESLQRNYIEYINTKDITLSCSRSGSNPLIFWYYLSTTPLEKIKEEALTNLKKAEYLFKQLSFLPICGKNDNSNIVYFTKPSQEICRRYQLATSEGITHVVLLQHVSQEILDKFIKEVKDWYFTTHA